MAPAAGPTILCTMSRSWAHIAHLTMFTVAIAVIVAVMFG
jgi:hypothetical protein